MKRILIFLLIVLVAIVAIISVITSVGKAGARRALNDYKAKLRAQGEKLTWEEFGYPRAIETNDCLPRLVQAVEQFGNTKLNPNVLKLMDVSSPTKIMPCWIQSDFKLANKNSKGMSWDKLEEELVSIEGRLAEIRAALTHPPVRLWTDPTNFNLKVQFHFVQQRTAAQWLSAELILALRQQNLKLAGENLYALQQMVQLQAEDPRLDCQMFHAAIAGLALASTWEALQATNWSDVDLTTLQSGWLRINLFRNLEIGVLGERLFAEATFHHLKGMGSSSQVQFLYGANTGFDYYWRVLVTTPLWQMNREADELLLLRHHQGCLDVIRDLNRGTNWGVVKQSLDFFGNSANKERHGLLGGVRYSLSAFMIPNFSRAALVVTRHETLRRLAVTAIALKRYEQKNHSVPAMLEMLVPDYLEFVPADPMSGELLRYQTNQTAFILYSVGEDGVDDGGDPTPPTSVKEQEIWSGKDFVWPMVTPTNY